MAQSTERNYAQTEDADRRGSDREEAKRMLDGMDEKKKGSTSAALDSIKKRYFSRLLGDKGIKVKSPKVSSVGRRASARSRRSRRSSSET